MQPSGTIQTFRQTEMITQGINAMCPERQMFQRMTMIAATDTNFKLNAKRSEMPKLRSI